MTNKVDGHEAYRDDPQYTAPEMQPGNGDNADPDFDPESAVVTGAGMTLGTGGGALAGEVLLEELEEEKQEMTPRRDV